MSSHWDKNVGEDGAWVTDTGLRAIVHNGWCQFGFALAVTALSIVAFLWFFTNGPHCSAWVNGNYSRPTFVEYNWEPLTSRMVKVETGSINYTYSYCAAP